MKDETRRKIDKAVKISLIVAGLLLICNDVYWRWHGGSGTQANNAVNRTVESIQKSNKSTGSEIESSRREIETAEKHVNRTADAIKRSEETARSNARSTDELQTIISECKGIVEAQRGIIRDVDRANGIGPEEDEQN
jgi:septal ring factor EnvC (AmiA/AmiB activator)